jgi:hypothetical protein
MPKDIQHLEQINRSKKLLQTEALDPNTAIYLEWTVVVIFYSAVHAIEWYFAKKGLGHGGNHFNRRNMMEMLSEFKTINAKYDLLQGESEKARYYCARYQKEDIPIYLEYLKEIEKVVGM